MVYLQVLTWAPQCPQRACSTEGAGAVMVCRDASLSLASPKNWAPAFREPIRPQELEA